MRIAIIGTGLIGGSVALAARRGTGVTITGFDADRAEMEGALALGAVDAIAGSPSEAVREAELVVLAAPVDRIPALCVEISGAVDPEATVTDVGSAKEAVVAGGERAFGARFVGGHPMAGSERHGIGAADARLFEGASWILTPTETTSSDSYRKVSELVTRVGATTVALEPHVHDRLVARLSHLPQLTASALVEVSAGAGDPDALLRLAGAGFRDVTRIAASRPELWLAILRSNREAVLESLDRMGEVLGRFERNLRAGEWGELGEALATSRDARLELFHKPVHTGDPVPLWLMIPDRPGVLAEVTTAAGVLGANIEDLRIVHSTEGGLGRLELVVGGEEPAKDLAGSLERLGYHVEWGYVDQ